MSTNWDNVTKSFLMYRDHGSLQDYNDFYRLILRPLNHYFSVRTRSQPDAEDLTQATLLKIHFARERFDPSQSFKTWIFTIASRTLIDLWRSSHSDGAKGVEEDDEDGNSVFVDDFNLEKVVITQLDLDVAMKDLTQIDQTIVYLYGIEQLTMAEIAKSLNMTENAVKLRAYRSYKKLRDLLSSILVLWAAMP